MKLAQKIQSLALTITGLLILIFSASAASLKTKNVVLITTDGLRWQEVFSGADESLMNKTNGGVKNVESLRKKFWRSTPEERRTVLMPFLWSEIATKGQLYGNQTKGSIARITNIRRFSYPGYNEILTGAPDDRIDSNNPVPNVNTNVLEWLNTRPALRGKVGAIVNWGVLPYILNTERSQISAWSSLPLPPNTPTIKISPELEALLSDTTRFWKDVTLDSFTARAAVDYIKEKKPRVFYAAFGETDEWGHEGRYDYLLQSAQAVDRYIQRLWETGQSLPEYRDQTTFIITTDHGRGSAPVEWRSHNDKISGAENIWIAVLGPDTPPLGERTNCTAVTQSQIAATLAAFLGEDYHAAFPKSAAPISEAIKSNGK